MKEIFDLIKKIEVGVGNKCYVKVSVLGEYLEFHVIWSFYSQELHYKYVSHNVFFTFAPHEFQVQDLINNAKAKYDEHVILHPEFLFHGDEE